MAACGLRTLAPLVIQTPRAYLLSRSKINRKKWAPSAFTILEAEGIISRNLHRQKLSQKLKQTNWKRKNLWRREYVRRALFRNVEGSNGALPPSTLTLFVTWLLGHCATYQGSSYIENEYNLFYHKLRGAFKK